MKVDNVLGPAKRFYDREKWHMPLGCRGERLFASWLKCEPGFAGLVGYAYHLDVPNLFQIHLRLNNEPIKWDSIKAFWYPSHILVTYRHKMLLLEERKFITHYDAAVSDFTMSNPGTEHVQVSAWVHSALFPGRMFTGGLGLSEESMLGREWTVVLSLSDEFDFPRYVPPGDKWNFRLSCLFARNREEAQITHKRIAISQTLFERHKRDYEEWFDPVPDFQCSDTRLTRLWQYRWWLLKACLNRPEVGNLRDWCFYEGIARPESLRVDPFAACMQLMEARWHPDPVYARDLIETLVKNDFLATRIFRHEDTEPNWLTHALVEACHVRPELKTTLSEHFDRLAWDVDSYEGGWDGIGVLPASGFPLPVNAGILGENGRRILAADDFDGVESVRQEGEEGERPHRPVMAVETASYYVANLKALATMAGWLGDTGRQLTFEERATGVQQALLEHMWDDERGFFYDLKAYQSPSDGRPAKARSRTLASLLPFWAGAAGLRHLRVLEQLRRGKGFVGRRAYVTLPDEDEDQTVQVPYWETMAAYALLATRNLWPNAEGELVRLMGDYAELQMPSKVPTVHRAYDATTGEPTQEGNEQDHFCSAWIDLILRTVIGLVPDAPGLELRPVNFHLDWFRLEKLSFRGHELGVTWLKVGAVTPVRGTNIEPGFRVFVDGKLQHHSATIQPVSLFLD